MTYLLYQIWLCLLVTAFIAGLLGWLLRGGGKGKLNALNSQWQDKYDTLSQERNSYASKMKKISGVTHEKERLESKISTQKQSFNQQINQLNEKLTDSDNEIQQQQTLLAQKDEDIATSRAQLDKKIVEVEAHKQTYKGDMEKELMTVKTMLLKTIKEKKQTVLNYSHLEFETKKHLKDEQEKTNHLKKTLTITQTELNEVTEKLAILQTDVKNKQLHTDTLVSDFSTKETHLINQLKEKQTLLTRLIADKEKAELTVKNAKKVQAKEVKESAISTIHQTKDNHTSLNISSQTTTTNDSSRSPDKKITHADNQKSSVEKRKSGLQQCENINNKDTLGIKNLFATTDFAGLAKSGIRKAKDSLHQAKESLTHYPDAKEAVFPMDAIQSVSNEDDKRLYAMNISTTQDLLRKTSTETSIQLLAKSLGKEEWVVRSWVNNADLIRISGVDGIIAELLILSGIDSITKVANSTVNEISEGIAIVHGHIKKRSTLPNHQEIQQFIDAAKQLTSV
ncbi:MAG: DUF4332 domain-containing protein [Cocleimonas sp.]|nr:DUF4332 domain-containing protein [Cocleimonas sp.]